MEDEKVIGLFFERSEQALKELSDKYGGLCTGLAQNILSSKEDADECVNEAYLGVWNSIPPQRPEKLSAYVLRIVRNLALKKLRHNSALKRGSSCTSSIEELSGYIPSRSGTESEYDAKLAAAAINSFLAGLEKNERVLFVRRFWYNESIGDLAKLFGTGSHNISVRLNRTKNKLRKHLEKEGVYL